MLLTGFCEVQSKDYTIEIDTQSPNALEDLTGKSMFKRISCDYASFGGKCNGSDCSILRQHNIKLG